MKTKAGVEKPLAEWTVWEVVDFCRSQSRENCGKVNCNGCCIWDTNICKMIPNSWNLAEKPKFTDAEKCDAAHIIHIFGNRHITVSRNVEGEAYVVVHINTGSENGLFINRDLFPSIKNGDKFSISEILGDEDA